MEKYKYMSFAMETASEYKYQIVMETVEQNTSKQVSAKETALQNTSKHSIFFFKNRVSVKKQRQESEMKISLGS